MLGNDDPYRLERADFPLDWPSFMPEWLGSQLWAWFWPVCFSQADILAHCTTPTRIPCGPGFLIGLSASRYSCSSPVLPPHHSRKPFSDIMTGSHSFLYKVSLAPDGFRLKPSCFAKPHLSFSSFCGPLYTLDIYSSLNSNASPCCHASVHAGPLAQKSLSKTPFPPFILANALAPTETQLKCHLQ